jgi:hypothetical protein
MTDSDQQSIIVSQKKFPGETSEEIRSHLILTMTADLWRVGLRKPLLVGKGTMVYSGLYIDRPAMFMVITSFILTICLPLIGLALIALAVCIIAIENKQSLTLSVRRAGEGYQVVYSVSGGKELKKIVEKHL